LCWNSRTRRRRRRRRRRKRKKKDERKKEENKEAVEDAGHINIHTTFGSYITNITSQKENTMGSWTAKLKLKGRIKYTAYN
jgi:hypothetical protein